MPPFILMLGRTANSVMTFTKPFAFAGLATQHNYS